ncbi:secreted RxLR effector protein 161-like [Nicotiana sylvestris]|uniref:secreted RxLR effector protein 161-like n=1 Tax=Nicotiana sylvestris TaxID=4096 RepID=UPI00388C61CB
MERTPKEHEDEAIGLVKELNEAGPEEGTGDGTCEPGSSVDQKLYRGMVGSLLYLTASRPDVVFSIELCARFQANPKESHLTIVKRILRYLKGTTDICLWYPKCSNFNLVGYADADYTGFLMDRKSTSGMWKCLSQEGEEVKIKVKKKRRVTV